MGNESIEDTITMSNRQRLFLRYTLAVLVDLTILNLFSEYWDLVYIEFFSISLLTAVLLQFLLQVTIRVEHYAASHFKKGTGAKALILRIISTWGILFISKLIILWLINLLFGDSVVFSGPFHGVVAFIAVVTAIVVIEELIIRINKALA